MNVFATSWVPYSQRCVIRTSTNCFTWGEQWVKTQAYETFGLWMMKKRINFVYCTIRGKITASHTTTMTRKHVKKGTFVRIPHPHCRILWTSQDYMSSWMPPDPLSSHSYSINTLTMWQQSHRHEISPQCLLQDRRVYTWDGENLCPRFGQFRPSFQMQATVHQYWRLSYTQNFHDLTNLKKLQLKQKYQGSLPQFMLCWLRQRKFITLS